MRVFLFILLVLFSRLCLAQNNDTLRKYLDKNFSFTTKSKMAYAAIVIPANTHWLLRAFYADGSLLIESTYMDKKLATRDGPLTAYYAANARALTGSFQNNQRVGTWRSWYKNGQLKDSGDIKNDKLTGTWITWYENGRMATRAHFTDEPGPITFMPGEAANETSLLVFPPPISVKSGTWETWSSNGNRKDSGNYVNDRKEGFWRSWYENGNPESEGAYNVEEKFVGDWTFYREDGTVSTKEKYSGNKLIDLKCFDEKGSPAGTFCSIAKPPVLLGTPYDWKVFFETHLEWSKETMKKSREGTITIRFFIGKDGKLTNHTLLNSPSEFVTKDIDKVISLMKDWSPAILHNRPFEYSFDYSVPFYP